MVAVEALAVSPFYAFAAGGGCALFGGPGTPSCYAAGYVAVGLVSEMAGEPIAELNETTMFPAIDYWDAQYEPIRPDNFCGHSAYGYEIRC